MTKAKRNVLYGAGAVFFPVVWVSVLAAFPKDPPLVDRVAGVLVTFISFALLLVAVASVVCAVLACRALCRSGD